MDVYNWGFLKQRCIRCGEDWWDCHICSTINPKISSDILSRYIEELEVLLKRLRQWDQLDYSADGAYWKREIDNLFKAWQQENQKTKKDLTTHL